MSYTQISSCPKCGAPIYSVMCWNGITPPPITYSCMCNSNNTTLTWGTNTSGVNFQPSNQSSKKEIDFENSKKALEELNKAFEFFSENKTKEEYTFKQPTFEEVVLNKIKNLESKIDSILLEMKKLK